MSARRSLVVRFARLGALGLALAAAGAVSLPAVAQDASQPPLEHVKPSLPQCGIGVTGRIPFALIPYARVDADGRLLAFGNHLTCRSGKGYLGIGEPRHDALDFPEAARIRGEIAEKEGTDPRLIILNVMVEQ